MDGVPVHLLDLTLAGELVQQDFAQDLVFTDDLGQRVVSQLGPFVAVLHRDRGAFRGMAARIVAGEDTRHLSEERRQRVDDHRFGLASGIAHRRPHTLDEQAQRPFLVADQCRRGAAGAQQLLVAGDG